MFSKVKNIFKNKSFKDVAWMMSANIIIKPFQIIKSFVVAKYLGPEQYGILKSVELIQMLNKFGNLGFVNTVIRDSGELIGKNDSKGLRDVKNICYSAELILIFVLFTIGLLSNFFFNDIIIRYAIVLSSIGLFSLKIYNIFSAEAIISKEFKLLSKLTIFQGFFNSVIIIVTVPFFNLFAVLSVPILSSLISCYYVYKRLNFSFSFSFKKKLLYNVLNTSLKLTSGTLAFGLFRYVERILVITYLGIEAVGIFGFADTLLAMFVTLFLTVIKVRKMNILEYLGKKEYLKVHNIVVKETLYLIFSSIVAVAIMQFLLNSLIPIYLEKWVDAIVVSQLFLLVLPLKVLITYFSVVVMSPTVDKLFYVPVFQLLGVVTLIFGIILLKYFDKLNLLNFIYLDIIAYFIINVPWIFVYYKEYYKKYILNIS
jgi:O-antigen/teichoic acid export membrane protein